MEQLNYLWLQERFTDLLAISEVLGQEVGTLCDWEGESKPSLEARDAMVAAEAVSHYEDEMYYISAKAPFVKAAVDCVLAAFAFTCMGVCQDQKLRWPGED